MPGFHTITSSLIIGKQKADGEIVYLQENLEFGDKKARFSYTTHPTGPIDLNKPNLKIPTTEKDLMLPPSDTKSNKTEQTGKTINVANDGTKKEGSNGDDGTTMRQNSQHWSVNILPSNKIENLSQATIHVGNDCLKHVNNTIKRGKCPEDELGDISDFTFLVDISPRTGIPGDKKSEEAKEKEKTQKENGAPKQEAEDEPGSKKSEKRENKTNDQKMQESPKKTEPGKSETPVLNNTEEDKPKRESQTNNKPKRSVEINGRKAPENPKEESIVRRQIRKLTNIINGDKNDNRNPKNKEDTKKEETEPQASENQSRAGKPQNKEEPEEEPQAITENAQKKEKGEEQLQPQEVTEKTPQNKPKTSHGPVEEEAEKDIKQEVPAEEDPQEVIDAPKLLKQVQEIVGLAKKQEKTKDSDEDEEIIEDSKEEHAELSSGIESESLSAEEDSQSQEDDEESQISDEIEESSESELDASGVDLENDEPSEQIDQNEIKKDKELFWIPAQNEKGQKLKFFVEPTHVHLRKKADLTPLVLKDIPKVHDEHTAETGKPTEVIKKPKKETEEYLEKKKKPKRKKNEIKEKGFEKKHREKKLKPKSHSNPISEDRKKGKKQPEVQKEPEDHQRGEIKERGPKTEKKKEHRPRKEKNQRHPKNVKKKESKADKIRGEQKISSGFEDTVERSFSKEKVDMKKKPHKSQEEISSGFEDAEERPPAREKTVKKTKPQKSQEERSDLGSGVGGFVPVLNFKHDQMVQEAPHTKEVDSFETEDDKGALGALKRNVEKMKKAVGDRSMLTTSRAKSSLLEPNMSNKLKMKRNHFKSRQIETNRSKKNEKSSLRHNRRRRV